MNKKNYSTVAFDKLAGRVGCDADSTAWLKAALDPFHDFNIAIAGIPDNDSQNSVVQIIPKVYTITAPEYLVPGTTWSVHICTLPLGSTETVKSYIRDVPPAAFPGSIHTLDGSQQGTLGTVSVIKHADTAGPYGANTSFPSVENDIIYSDNYGNNVSRTVEAYSIDDNNPATMKKLIFGGFEVHNDTAALYKQGSVTVYSSAQSVSQCGMARFRDGTLSEVYSTQGVRKIRQPPASKSEAASLPDSRTWSAAEGCYVPIRLGDDTHYNLVQEATFLVERSDTSSKFTGSVGYAGVRPNAEISLTGSLTHRPLDLETTGAYFSGLSAETTLTLTLKFCVELCPTNANSSLLYMASPTAMYCPQALELYHQIIRSMPPGVPVDFNDKGDWFRMATNVISEVAPLVAPFLTAYNPALGAATTGIGKVAGILSKAKPKPKPITDSLSKVVSKPNRNNKRK